MARGKVVLAKFQYAPGLGVFKYRFIGAMFEAQKLIENSTPRTLCLPPRMDRLPSQFSIPK